MIVAVESGEAVVTTGRTARLGAGGVVARPGLFARLSGPSRVAVVAAPAGSGKTVLLRSWISEAGLDGRAAWVPSGRVSAIRSSSGCPLWPRCARQLGVRGWCRL